MKNVPWRVSVKGSTVARGVKEAESEREVMDDIFRNPPFEVDDETYYDVTAGGLTGGSYGDEFDMMAGASSLDESEVKAEDGYLFKPTMLPGMTPKEDDPFDESEAEKNGNDVSLSYQPETDLGVTPGEQLDGPGDLDPITGRPKNTPGSRPAFPHITDLSDVNYNESHEIDSIGPIGTLGAKRVVTGVRRHLEMTMPLSKLKAMGLDPMSIHLDRIKITHPVDGQVHDLWITDVTITAPIGPGEALVDISGELK